MDGIGDGHVLGVPYQIMENFGFAINSINGFFVPIVEEAKVGPKEIPGQKGEYLVLVQD